MSYLFRLKLFSFLILTNSIVFLGQSGFRTCKMSDLVTSEAQGKRILKYKEDIFETSEEQVKILIFVDTSNVLLKGGLLLSELDILKEAINSSSLSSKSCFYIIKGQSPRVGGNYFEFPKKDFAISDFPVYILHSSRIENLVFDAYAQFSYVGEYINGKRIIRFLPPESSCGKYNFLRPLHGELIRIAEQLESQPIQTKIAANIDFSNYLNEMNSGFSGIRKDLKDVKDQIKALDDKLKESEDDKFSKFRFEPSFRFANNFSEMSYHLFYHDDVKRSHYFVFGISAGELQGNTRLDNYEYRDGFSTYSISGIQESSLTKFNGLSVGYKHIKDFDGGPLEIHTRIGMQLNRIVSSNYSWSSGEMDVRGKLDGIGDEIINVPELGFQENQILLGVSGENQVKRFFGSVDLDLSLHYNLEKIDFFLGCGGIASTKIQPMKSDALIFNGRQFNGLMSTVQPMSLINAYITLGASIIF